VDYQIYIPEARGCSSDRLRAVGLETLLDADTPVTGLDVLGGPDRGAGVMFYFGDHPRPGYHPAEQTWSPCKPSGDRPAKRFWMGRSLKSPLVPHDIARRPTLGGIATKLADDQLWLVPTPKRLPRVYELDGLGRPVRALKSIYRDWVDRAWEYFELVLKWRAEGGELGLTVAGGFFFAVGALGMNYRLNADLVDWLGLVDDMAFLRILNSVFELDALEALEHEKKNLAVPAI
jgi:hypothetical protein